MTKDNIWQATLEGKQLWNSCFQDNCLFCFTLKISLAKKIQVKLKIIFPYQFVPSVHIRCTNQGWQIDLICGKSVSGIDIIIDSHSYSFQTNDLLINSSNISFANDCLVTWAVAQAMAQVMAQEMAQAMAQSIIWASNLNNCS